MSEVDVETFLNDLRRLETEAWGVANFYANGDQGLMFYAIDEANTLSNAIKIIEGNTMDEEETIKRLRAEREAAHKTYKEALDVWEPARDVERAAKRALDTAHTAWFALDRGLYSATKARTQ